MKNLLMKKLVKVLSQRTTITIIIMIILTGAIIVALSEIDITGEANYAVGATNEKTMQQMAQVAWAEAYAEKIEDSTVNIPQRANEILKAQVGQA